jgi:hypothetical protein
MLIFVEGFDWAASGTAQFVGSGRWPESSGSVAIGNTTADLRFGAGTGQYMIGASQNDYIRKPFASNQSAGIFGMALKRPAATTNFKNNVFVLFDTTANVQMGLLSNADGTLSVFRGSHSNILGTSTWAQTANQYAYIEFKWKIADSISSGDVEVKVDGTSVLTISAGSDTQATANAYATHFAIWGNTPTITSASASPYYWDDFYYCDLTGSTNNTFLGPIRICTLFPTGNGNSSQMVGSDGNSTNNFQLVDEVGFNSDTDYVESATVGDKDTYGITDLPSTTNTVFGLQINTVARRTDTDAKSIAAVVRSGGTDYDQTGHSLGSTYALISDILETDPADSSAFTVSDVNNLEVGVKVSA